MKDKLPKTCRDEIDRNIYIICDASTSKVLHCENTDCPYHIKHYDSLDDWLIVHPSNVDCKDKEKEE